MRLLVCVQALVCVQNQGMACDKVSDAAYKHIHIIGDKYRGILGKGGEVGRYFGKNEELLKAATDVVRQLSIFTANILPWNILIFTRNNVELVVDSNKICISTLSLLGKHAVDGQRYRENRINRETTRWFISADLAV